MPSPGRVRRVMSASKPSNVLILQGLPDTGEVDVLCCNLGVRAVENLPPDSIQVEACLSLAEGHVTVARQRSCRRAPGEPFRPAGASSALVRAQKVEKMSMHANSHRALAVRQRGPCVFRWV